jgi:hypothetical protein
MTRENDEFPGGASTKDEALRKRVDIANKIKPAAFISIHLNTASPNKEYTKESGIEAYVSNKRNDDEGKKLASVILQNLAGVYATKQELKYRSQAGIWVLDQNTCPSILLECGFINNAEDLAFITSKDNQEKIARKILEAVVKFRSKNFEMAIGNARDTVPSKFRKNSVFVSHPDKIILQADTIIYHKTEGKVSVQNLGNSLIIINDTKQEPGILTKMTVIADEVQIYSKGDPEAVRLYGSEAAEGLVIFKNAKLIATPSAAYYKEELNQKTDDTDNKIFEKVEIEPSFPGGSGAWNKYLEKNLNASIAVEEHAPAGEYTVYAEFIVHKDGSVSDVKALTNHGFGMEKEMLRIIKLSPKWIPGIQNGYAVNAYRKQRVDFVVAK